MESPPPSQGHSAEKLAIQFSHCQERGADTGDTVHEIFEPGSHQLAWGQLSHHSWQQDTDVRAKGHSGPLVSSNATDSGTCLGPLLVLLPDLADVLGEQCVAAHETLERLQWVLVRLGLMHSRRESPGLLRTRLDIERVQVATLDLEGPIWPVCWTLRRASHLPPEKQG